MERRTYKKAVAAGAVALTAAGAVTAATASPAAAHAMWFGVNPGQDRGAQVRADHRLFTACNWVTTSVRLANGSTMTRSHGSGCGFWETPSRIVELRVRGYQSYGTDSGWKRVT